MKRFICILLCLLLLSGCSVPTSDPMPDTTPVASYQEGYDDGLAAAQAEYQAQVDRLENEAAIATATIQEHENSLSVLPEQPAPPVSPTPPAPIGQGTVKGKDVNLRAAPGTDATIVQKVSQPAVVEVLEQHGDWYLVSVGGVSGYLRQDLIAGLTMAGETTPITPVSDKSPLDTPQPTTSTTATPLPTATPKAGTAYVWLSATGSKYHRINNCGNMNPQNARQVTLESVKGQYDPCKNCRPPT